MTASELIDLCIELENTRDSLHILEYADYDEFVQETSEIRQSFYDFCIDADIIWDLD